MCSGCRKARAGLTIIELLIAMVIGAMLASVVGVLLVSGQRAWNKAYISAHKRIKEDARDITIRFGSIGRKANRLDYAIYDIADDTFTPAAPQGPNPEEVVSGDAVEFRYWDVELDSEDSHELLDVTKTGTVYALFYVSGDELKIDYGPYPPGGVPAGGGSRNTTDVTTSVLAENVTTDPNLGAFSHTTLNGVGQGCVRINITLTDPEDGESIQVMTATMMRNIWPR